MPPLKEHISRASVTRLGEVLAAGDRCLDVRRFAEEASRGLDQLPLKARVAQVAVVLAHVTSRTTPTRRPPSSCGRCPPPT